MMSLLRDLESTLHTLTVTCRKNISFFEFFTTEDLLVVRLSCKMLLRITKQELLDRRLPITQMDLEEYNDRRIDLIDRYCDGDSKLDEIYLKDLFESIKPTIGYWNLSKSLSPTGVVYTHVYTRSNHILPDTVTFLNFYEEALKLPYCPTSYMDNPEVFSAWYPKNMMKVYWNNDLILEESGNRYSALKPVLSKFDGFQYNFIGYKDNDSQGEEYFRMSIFLEQTITQQEFAERYDEFMGYKSEDSEDHGGE